MHSKFFTPLVSFYGFLFGLVVFSFFISCRKEECHPTQLADLRFTEIDLKMDPYTGSDSLTFISETGSGFSLTEFYRERKRDANYEIDYEEAKIYHDGCRGDFFYSEYDWMSKYDSLSDSRLVIQLFFNNILEHPGVYKYLNLFFYTHDPKLICFDARFIFSNDTIYNFPDPHYVIRDSVRAFHQEIAILGKSFSNVYELSCSNPDHRDTAWISTAYYSVAKGLVGFKTTYGKRWVLSE